MAATVADHRHLCFRLWTSSVMIHVAWPDGFGSAAVGWRIVAGWKIVAGWTMVAGWRMAFDKSNAVDSGWSPVASFAVPAVASAGWCSIPGLAFVIYRYCSSRPSISAPIHRYLFYGVHYHYCRHRHYWTCSMQPLTDHAVKPGWIHYWFLLDSSGIDTYCSGYCSG